MTADPGEYEARRLRGARVPFGGMTEAELDALAKRAAKKALAHVYEEVGKSAVRKFLWLVGLVTFGLALWLAGKDALPK